MSELGRRTIRLMRADDDLDAELDLRHRSFGPMSTQDCQYWREEMLGCIADGRQLGVWDGGQLVGAARYYDMRQYWHGRAVPMAGVGGVKIAPEARGRGIGREMMRALLGAMAGRGYPLSVLYPATAQIYRSLGWEMAGGHYRAEVPGRSLLALLPPDPELPPRDPEIQAPDDHEVPVHPGESSSAVRRAGPDDAGEVIAVLGAIHAAARDCGPATRDPASMRRWLGDPGLFSYLAPDGFLGYGWHGSGDKEIMIEVLAAGSPQTARALWGIVASHSSVTRVVRATLGPSDPVGWLTREPDVSLRRHKHWMLRVLDPAAGVSGRGFPPAARASIPIRLADPDLPRNAGLYTFTVHDGTGSLVRGITGPTGASPAAAPVALGPRGFAALYAGVPMATLRAAGLVAGGDRHADAALDAVFTAQPFLLDYF
ncbi:MAG TPA: GNAT family N-acetyltransferase [Streptosporangiaceae bacterium]